MSDVPLTLSFVSARRLPLAGQSAADGVANSSDAMREMDSGRMVELVPGRFIDVPLYWQDSRLAVPMLERLTACVSREAAAALLPGGGRGAAR